MTAQISNGGGRPLVARALEAARDHQDAGRPDAAALLYRQVLDVEPTNAEALEGLVDTAPTRVAQRRSLPRRAVRRVAREGLETLTVRPRIWKYQLLSTCPRVQGRPRIIQPVLFLGAGEIVLGDDVQFGWKASPLFHTGYGHVEAGHPDSRITIGDRVEINNNGFLKSEGPGISIGAGGLFGANVEIFDSNFHDLDPGRRVGGTPRTARVDIGDNVFVGMGVRILKGVTIGADSVIGAGAVVSSAIPAGVIAAGNPARVVREL